MKKKFRIIEQLRKKYPEFGPWSYSHERHIWVGNGVTCEARVGLWDNHAHYWFYFESDSLAPKPADVYHYRERLFEWLKTPPTAST